MSLLEIAAVVVSAAGLWLLARRNLWSWPVSLLGILLYVKVFLVNKLYSDMLLQVIFAISCAYGWMKWRRRLDGEGAVSLAVPSRRETIIGVVVGALGSVALGQLMMHYTDAAAPRLDATLSCFSLVAQLWTARRFIQSWWLWIALDVIYVCLYCYKGLYLTSGLYAFNIVLCVYGLVEWRNASLRGAIDQTLTETRSEKAFPL